MVVGVEFTNSDLRNDRVNTTRDMRSEPRFPPPSKGGEIENEPRVIKNKIIIFFKKLLRNHCSTSCGSFLNFERMGGIGDDFESGC